MVSKHVDSTVAAFIDRRDLIKKGGLATLALGAGAAAAEPAAAQSRQRHKASPAAAQSVTDADILNFALNLEYLEAEYYLRAATGRGVDSKDTGGTGAHGKVVGGSKVSFEDQALEKFALEIARDEEAHVKFLRSALGSAAVAEPEIDLQNSFTTLARLAGLVGEHDRFNPFENEQNFLLGAFVFEDVGVTAYHGAAPLLANKAYLSAAAGLLAVEAYHAGGVRTLLFQRALFKPAQEISAARAKAAGADDDQGIVLNDRANIVPVDNNGVAFSRTPSQVLNIVYLGGAASKFGFFPDKLNGKIT
jgi:hypothetical protein